MDLGKSKKAQLPFKPPFFYGWVIVIVSSITLFFSGPGQTYSVSTFIDHYASEFGWSRSVISGMYSMGTLVAGLTMGIIGNLFDRRGHRIMTTIVALLLGLACFWMSLVNHLIMLLAGFLMLRLLGQGSMSLSGSTLVPQWFIEKRGRAISLIALGHIAGSAFLPPLNTWIIQAFGWQIGWRFWAIMQLIVMTPIAYIFIRDRPEYVGLWPDDLRVTTSTIDSGKMVIKEDAWTLKEAMGTRSFWLLLFCMMIPSAIATGLIFHQISIMGLVGLNVEAAAMVLTAMAVVRLPGAFVAGQIFDRLPPRYLIAFAQVMLLASMVVLIIANSMITALVYGVLLGIVMSIQGIAGGVVWPKYYGRLHLGSIRGITMMAGVIGSALGPLPYGISYDIFGSYHQALIMFMIFPIMGTIAAILSTKPKRAH